MSLNINSIRFPGEKYCDELASSTRCTERLIVSPSFQFISRTHGRMSFHVVFANKRYHPKHPLFPTEF